MTHVSTRRASRRLTSGVAAVALAATCFAAVSVTALPASADTTETSAAAASDSQAVHPVRGHPGRTRGQQWHH